METHPEPEKALSDGPNAWPLDRMQALLQTLQTLDATIKAVNEAGLHHYVAKPWDAGELCAVVKEQLTEFVLGQEDSLLPYVARLDGPRLLVRVKDPFPVPAAVAGAVDAPFLAGSEKIAHHGGIDQVRTHRQFKTTPDTVALDH